MDDEKIKIQYQKNDSITFLYVLQPGYFVQSIDFGWKELMMPKS